MKILAIESSCDETAAAVIEFKDGDLTTISNIVASQIDIHTKYGGVVPEVAARAHIENIIPVIKEALTSAEADLGQIDRIAVTQGPGLIGSLVVGVETAKALAVAKNIPLFPINHLEGHIYASFLRKIRNPKSEITNNNQIDKTQNWKKPAFPILALLVSGGNSLLVVMKDHFKYEVVGQTRDDAAGEAFDKGAKLLDLGYPGGPIISKLATNGNAAKYDFPLIDLTQAPRRNAEGFMEKPEHSLDFSFSGLKTSLLTKVKTLVSLTGQDRADLAAGYEQAIVDTLVQNSLRAVEKYQPKTFVLAGGVAANKNLREKLGKELRVKSPATRYVIPDTSLCGDNAAMIGAVAAFRPEKSATTNFSADPSSKLH